MDPQEQNGYVTEGDRKVTIVARDWTALKLAVWRSKVGWDIVAREAKALVDRASHAGGCPGAASETESCLRDCPDRELRLSALVILNAARQWAPPRAAKIAEGPFIAPSREFYSEVLSALATCQSQLEAIDPSAVPLPPPNHAEEKTP